MTYKKVTRQWPKLCLIYMKYMDASEKQRLRKVLSLQRNKQAPPPIQAPTDGKMTAQMSAAWVQNARMPMPSRYHE